MAAEHVHLIGIGGTGMTALAGLLAASGCRVTGSDRGLYPPTSTILETLGLEVYEGFDAAHLRPAPDLVVVGNAISRGNPEVEELLDRDLDYTSMPRLLHDRFLRRAHSVVVAGTHGKTTTVAMLAWVLHHAGRDPSFLVGGLPRNFPLPFRLGAGGIFVIEGDEYDTAFFDKGPKFMHYRPDTVLLGTVEFDHADIYSDLDQIRTAFRRLVQIVPRRGLLVRHEDCAVTREVSEGAPCRVTGYGLERGAWRAKGVASAPDATRFEIELDGRRWAEATLPVGGEHNVRNALSVAAAASALGLAPAEVAAGFATYEGVRRRLELRGEANGVVVLDDFAHHPTAIDATLRAARQRFPRARVWAVVEPRSWSMRRNVFQERLAAAFDAADRIVLAAVWGADGVPEGERLEPDRLVADLARRGRSALFLPGAAEIAAHVAAGAEPGDVVVVMSNGSFGGLHERLLEQLAARPPLVRGKSAS